MKENKLSDIELAEVIRNEFKLFISCIKKLKEKDYTVSLSYPENLLADLPAAIQNKLKEQKNLHKISDVKIIKKKIYSL